jgi:hypothetical protein
MHSIAAGDETSPNLTLNSANARTAGHGYL